MNLLVTILAYYWSFITFCAVGSLFLAFSRISLGIRERYVAFLLYLFDWGHEKCQKRGIERDVVDQSICADQSNGHLPASSKETPTKALSSRHLLRNCSEAPDTTFWERLRHLSGPPGRSKDIALDTRFEIIMDESFCWAQLAVEAIITDEVTQSFDVFELPTWNLLTRTDRGYAFVSVKLFAVWLVGIVFRFGVLFPVRLVNFIMGMLFLTISTILVGLCLPEGRVKRALDRGFINPTYFQFMARALSLDANFHNREFRARPGGICVANHTSPIDMVVLGVDNYYSLVGQVHKGILGIIQRGLNRVTPHIWFERMREDDRSLAKRLLKEHTEAGKPPTLIFPEGVCVNNTAVMEFKKGSFEVDAPIYPVAIKYDRRLGEPFWFQDTWAPHLFELMTSWAVKCDVYYLPPMSRDPAETAVDFAQRVKKEIAIRGGLVDVHWDGMLKYKPVRSEQIERIKLLCSERFKTVQDS